MSKQLVYDERAVREAFRIERENHTREICQKAIPNFPTKDSPRILRTMTSE